MPTTVAVAGDSARVAEAEIRRGLSESEAARRLVARGSLPGMSSSRSYASIVRANVFTVFNLILLVLGVLTLTFGAWEDALFLGVLVANSAIGIGQEVRAKRALDRLALLAAARATVVRDGRRQALPVEEVVVGDLVTVGPGDQLVADGGVISADGLALDESVLTGETKAVERRAGDTVRSGAFVVDGAGEYEVTAVGPESYAGRITGEARRFRHPRSPLERALARLLLVLVALIVPLGALIGFALWHRHTALSNAVPTAVAAVVTLVPEGLILLASLTFAVSALRMAKRGALAQQLNAIESLASVDVICLDKTGTLTEPQLHVVELVAAQGTDERALHEALGSYAAAAAHRNSTLAAIAQAFPAQAVSVERAVPFSSERRFGAAVLGGEAYVLGAPELFSLRDLGDRAREAAGGGRRVVAFGVTKQEHLAGEEFPAAVRPLAIVVLAERLRPNARETVEFFQAQGVRLKVLSGDSPDTVAAIARDLGIRDAEQALDGRHLPEDGAQLESFLERSGVVGRIAPEDKRRVVETLRDAGHYVAMVGDGVNDVPALKAARLAIAQGSGTQMAKSVSDVVLVSADFGSVPPMVAEGRKVLRNVQRVAKLFVTKSAFATFLILSIGLTPTAYPLLPRHLTLAASLTIGIPGFFLALAPSKGAFNAKHFLRETARFAVPAGTAAGLGVIASYLFALNVAGLSLVQARTVATTVLVAVGLYLIYALEASRGRRRLAVTALCAAMAASYAAVLALGWSRRFFALGVPTPAIVAIALVGAGIAVVGLLLTDERFRP
jgi:cation-transporting ATPase E